MANQEVRYNDGGVVLSDSIYNVGVSLGQQKRISERKELHAPIKLIANESLILIGQAIDISLYGLKVEIVSKNENKAHLIDEPIFAENMVLEIVAINAGNKIHLSLKAPAYVKWSTHRYEDEYKIYEIGFAFKLHKEQLSEWHKFYEEIQAPNV